MKHRAPTSSLRMVSSLWVALAVLGFQVATASEDKAIQDDPVEFEILEDNLQSKVIYEDDLEDDQGLAYEDELEDDTITPEDIEDINEARKVLEEIRNDNTRATIESPPGTTTIVTEGNQYVIVSHDDFGTTRYPNRHTRRWWFYKGHNIEHIVLKCPFFRIQWSAQCRKDKFGVFKQPFVRGIRRCGQIHGFYKKYDVGIKVVFKTDPFVRRAGFTCIAQGIPFPPTTTTSSSTSTTTTSTTTTSTSTTTTSTTTTYAPGCPVAPTVPLSPTTVTTCADILAGYDYCTCEDVTEGICLTCSICTACDMEVFAVHDFSNIDLYVYLHFNCPEYPVDANSLSFGHESVTKGYVVCFPPPSHVILPTYPTSTSGAVVIVASCPIDPAINVCSVFQSNGRRSLLDHSSLLHGSKKALRDVREQQELLSLESINGIESLAFVGIAADLSTLPHPEVVKNLTVVDSTCLMFPENEAIDLSSFTTLQHLSLNLCIVPCSNVNIILTSTPLANADIECVFNQASDSTHVYVTA